MIMCSWRKTMPGTTLPREKPEECTVKQLQRSLDRSCSWLGEFLKLFVHKGTWRLACLVVIQLVTPNNPINACALSLVPRLSLFSEVSYWTTADFANRETCSFIRLNDAFRKTLLQATKKNPRKLLHNQKVIWLMCVSFAAKCKMFPTSETQLLPRYSKVWK